jgi:hypothetical protein
LIFKAFKIFLKQLDGAGEHELQVFKLDQELAFFLIVGAEGLLKNIIELVRNDGDEKV